MVQGFLSGLPFVRGATLKLDLPKGWEKPVSLHVFDREGGVCRGRFEARPL